MSIEVALIDSDARRGVRLLGRSTDPDLVETVRQHLVDQLLAGDELGPAVVRLIKPAAEPGGGQTKRDAESAVTPPDQGPRD